MRLDPLFKPSSVAVLGASTGPSVGRDIVESLGNFGFSGPIYPVNPKYDSILDMPCYASLTDLPAPPDVVAFCVGSTRVLENFRMLPEIGAKAAVIFGGGYAEQGEEGQKVQQELIDICAAGNIALCGPNCMGVINPTAGSATYLQIARDPAALVGNVGLVSQSGSVCISLLSDTSRFGFSLVASAGNEAVTSTADYIDYMVDHAETKVIATFSESVADPEKYVAALDRAADKGKPVIVLKAGKVERTRRAIASHTGGLAGDSRVFSEVLRAHRAIEVNDLDELVEMLVVCQGDRWPKGPRMVVVTSSGGMAELILDRASEFDLQMPAMPADEMGEIERVIGQVSGDGNPLDAWGNGDFKTNMPHALEVTSKSPATDSLVFCYDNHDDAPMGRIETVHARAKFLRQSALQSDKPHYQMTMRPGLKISAQIPLLAECGVPTLFGVRQGLQAIDRLAHWVSWRERKREPAACGAALTDFRPAGRKTVNEYDSKCLMGALGMRVTRERLAASAEEAVATAEELGFPVVMKAVSDDIPHKTEFGLVLVGLDNADDVVQAWGTLEARLAKLDGAGADAGVLVQEMVSEGIEVFAGVTHTPGFGHALAFGMGGVAIEVSPDYALRLLPLRDGEAETMIGEIRGAALFGAVRGRPPADTASLAACLYALSDLIANAGPLIQEIDLNPIKVLPEGQGCIVVDALIVPANQKGE